MCVVVRQLTCLYYLLMVNVVTFCAKQDILAFKLLYRAIPYVSKLKVKYLAIFSV